MFSANANIFNHPNQITPRATATRRRSVERRPNMPLQGQSQGKGYGCAVYQDYLVLLGTTTQEIELNGGSVLCAYNLREKRAEQIDRERFPFPIGACTPCLYHKLNNGVIFYGKVETPGGRPVRFGAQLEECITLALRLEKRRGGNFPSS